MDTKPYKHQEEDTSILCDTALEYQTGASKSHLYVIPENELPYIMRAKEQFARGEYYTEEEMEKRIEEWLS